MVWHIDPFEYFRRLHHEMERAFALPWDEHIAVRPAAANIYETETAVIAEFELPGVDKKEIKVQITPSEVELRVERKEEKEEKAKRFYRHEARAASFYRRLSLPVEVVSEKAKATFRNGVLRIEAPKAKPAKKEGVHELTIE